MEGGMAEYRDGRRDGRVGELMNGCMKINKEGKEEKKQEMN
jgi:hypothetical protein